MPTSETLPRGFQLHGAYRPDVVVEARDGAEVAAAVRDAARRGAPVAVQGRGHGIPATPDGGVLISTAAIDHVRIAGDRAIIGAGACWRDVVAAAAEHGLAPLSGSAPDVGAVSYTLGGGLSLLGRLHGWAADHVHRVELVTADGRLRQVTADSDPDLFWAVRGGRGAFGIATEIEVGLVELPEFAGGSITFDTPHLAAAVHAWRRWTIDLPEAVHTSIALVPIPDVEGPPPFLRGRHIAMVRVAYAGPAAELDSLVEPLRAGAPVLLDTIGPLRFTESGSIYDDPTEPVAYRAVNRTLSDLPADALERVLALAGPDAAEPGIVEIRQLGGALSRPPAIPNAVGRRGAAYSIGSVEMLGDLDAARRRQNALVDALAPWTTGRILNFMTGDETTVDDVRDAFEPADYRRLQQLKARYDPADVFSRTHRIVA